MKQLIPVSIDGWWCLMPLSTIFQLYMAVRWLVQVTGVPDENHWPAMKTTDLPWKPLNCHENHWPAMKTTKELHIITNIVISNPAQPQHYAIVCQWHTACQWFSWQVSGFHGRSVVFIAGQWLSWQISGFPGRSVVFMACQWSGIRNNNVSDNM
jgi:hypothetical protein